MRRVCRDPKQLQWFEIQTSRRGCLRVWDSQQLVRTYKNQGLRVSGERQHLHQDEATRNSRDSSPAITPAPQRSNQCDERWRKTTFLLFPAGLRRTRFFIPWFLSFILSTIFLLYFFIHSEFHLLLTFLLWFFSFFLLPFCFFLFWSFRVFLFLFFFSFSFSFISSLSLHVNFLLIFSFYFFP